MSTCSGRVGAICDRVRRFFNEAATDGILGADSLLVDHINQCVDDLARSHYWTKTGLLNLAADTEAYSLTAALPDYVDLIDLQWTDTLQSLHCCDNRNIYTYYKQQAKAGTHQYYYYVETNTLYVAPVPTAAGTGVLTAHYAYHPGALACLSSYTPDLPSTYDNLFVYYTLWQCFMRDRHARTADEAAKLYLTLYQQLKAQLLGQRIPPMIGLRPYR